MPEGANIYALFAEAAARAERTPLIIERGQVRLRYDELDSLTARWANALGSLGARVGDRVLVQVEKSPANILLYLACLRAGLVYVPLNTAYTPAEVAYFIADAEPAVVVCDSRNRKAIAAVAGGMRITTLAGDGSGELAESAAGPGGAFATVACDARDLAAILYTSGTTGRSKGAMLSHGALASNALTLKDYWRWEPGDVLIHALPIYHVHGLFVALHGALLNGTTMLWHAAFDAGAVIDDFARATILMGVPTFYVRFAAHSRLTREAAAGMRLFVSGSAPLLEATFAEFEEKTGHRILERYGMTEAGMIASNPYDGERIAGTVGYALPGIEARVAGDDGREAARGEPGVLEIRGPNLFSGYWRQPERTAEEMRRDGFFVTGDAATMAADGRIAIVGRAKDLIIAGGLNIYPKEVELAIDAIEGVGESAVIGVSHPDLGEAVVAVVTRSNPALDEATVLTGIADKLARFKQPRRIVFVDTLPRNAMGKVQKAVLREEYGTMFEDQAAVISPSGRPARAGRYGSSSRRSPLGPSPR